jgi:hypothetical protein
MYMNNLEVTENLQEIDNSQEAQLKIALEKLENKEFFKKLILQGFFKDYAFELAMELIHPSTVEEGRRNNVVEKLVGLARVKDYFEMVVAMSSTEEGYGEKLDKDYDEFRKNVIEMNTALDEAEKDPDFKMLVEEAYCKQYAIDQTSMITNDLTVRRNSRAYLFEALAGVSTLRNYLVDTRKRYADVMANGDEE